MERAIGAVYSQHLIPGSYETLYGVANALRKGVAVALNDPSIRDIPLSSTGIPDNLRGVAARFLSQPLLSDRVEFWRGWKCVDQRGKPTYLRLYALHRAHGAELARALHASCQRSMASKSVDGPKAVSEFAAFLADLPATTIDKLGDPQTVETILANFLRFYFESKHGSGGKVRVMLRAWKSFVLFLEQYVLGEWMGRPRTPVPSPPAPRCRPDTLHVRIGPSGESEKYKLLTPVPLAASDTEAKEILFKRIQRDADLIDIWAQTRFAGICERAEISEKALAYIEALPDGFEIPPSGRSQDRGSMIEACAVRFAAQANPRISCPARFPLPKREAAFEIGLPSALDLLAAAAILVRRHPCITSSFIETLDLYDDQERLVGLRQVDGARYLIGTKPRRGPELAEQRVTLSAETSSIVERVVSITRPLRCVLKAQGDPDWTKLFLYTPTISSRPKRLAAPQQCYSLQQALAAELAHIAGIDAAESAHLAQNFSLASLRASAGVLVYLATGSAAKMSEALGHSSYSPANLEHYLPSAVRTFFDELWVRKLQATLVCEALRDSDHRLLASGFESWEDLDAFLARTTLMRPPGTDAIVKSESRECLVNVNEEILGMLRSVELAVERDFELSSGVARHWAELSAALRPQIIAREDLRPLLERAELSAHMGLISLPEGCQ